MEKAFFYGSMINRNEISKSHLDNRELLASTSALPSVAKQQMNKLSELGSSWPG
jgi:hypothetical protein